MCSESLGSEKVSYGPCAHQESCESLAAMAKFLVIRFDRINHWSPLIRPAIRDGYFLGGGGGGVALGGGTLGSHEG